MPRSAKRVKSGKEEASSDDSLDKRRHGFIDKCSPAAASARHSGGSSSSGSMRRHTCFTTDMLRRIAIIINHLSGTTSSQKSRVRKMTKQELYEYLRNIDILRGIPEWLWIETISTFSDEKHPDLEDFQARTFKPIIPEALHDNECLETETHIEPYITMLTKASAAAAAAGDTTEKVIQLPTQFTMFKDAPWTSIAASGFTDCRYAIQVINTTEDYRRGTHYVAYLVDRRLKVIFHFDSMGVKVDKQSNTVNMYSRNLVAFVKKDNPQYKSITNEHPIQNDSVSCGIYALLFLERLLKALHMLQQYEITDAADCMTKVLASLEKTRDQKKLSTERNRMFIAKKTSRKRKRSSSSSSITISP